MSLIGKLVDRSTAPVVTLLANDLTVRQRGLEHLGDLVDRDTVSDELGTVFLNDMLKA
jgi:hypothetical protein